MESNQNINNQGAVNTNTESNQNDNNPENKTYTQAEVEKLLQAETDRRVNQALAKAERKNAEAVREAEKLAKMSASEKFQYELEQREKAIAEKERALAMAENKNEASKILADKGISLALVDFVVDESADVMNDRIKLLDTEFKKSVRAEVEKRLGAGNTAPKNSSTTIPTTVTPEIFAKMSPAQRQKLANSDRDLYDQLTGRLH